MRAFITGSTGFLGTNLVHALDKSGWEIIAFHRKTSDLKELKKCRNIQFATGDVTDLKSLEEAIPEGVDAVFHCAGSVGNLPHSEENTRYLVNQIGTQNVVKACLPKKIGRLIYTTTVLTYDFHAVKILNESAPRNLWSQDSYIRSKRLADEEVDKGLEAGLDVVYLHPSALFGAYDKDTWSKLFREIQRGLPMPFAPPGGGSVCHAAPVAQAHIQAYHKAPRGEHYILGGPDVTWLEVLQEISKMLGKKGPTMKLPEVLFKAYGWTEFLISTSIKREPMLTPHTLNILSETIYSNSSHAIKDLNYNPSSLKTMLTDCHEWMKSSGLL